MTNQRSTYRTSIPALVLLFIYLLNPLKLYLPYLDYQVNFEYISAFLCENKDKPALECNGKCYLSKALKDTQDKETDHNKLIVKNFSAEELPAEVTLITSGSQSVLEITQTGLIDNYRLSYSKKTSPPPKSIG